MNICVVNVLPRSMPCECVYWRGVFKFRNAYRQINKRYLNIAASWILFNFITDSLINNDVSITFYFILLIFINITLRLGYGT
jgi:hypothetical protein